MNRYSAYKESGIEWIGEIPSHWGLKRLKIVSALITTKRPPSDGEIKISPENVESFSGKVTNFYSNHGTEGVEFLQYDTLFNKLGVYLSKVVFCGFSGLSMGEMIVVRPHSIFPKFQYNLLSSSLFIDSVNSISEGVKLPRSSVSGIMNTTIPLPPSPEQKLISRYLDKKTEQIDSLIEKTQRKVELLKEQRTALINQCVTKGLDSNVEMEHSGIEWIGEIPSHWKHVSNKRLFSEYFGGSWGDDPAEGQVENLVRVIRVTEFDFPNLTISKDIPTIRSLKLKNDSWKLVQKNDLILEKSGGGEKTPVGRVVMMDKEPQYPTINSNFTNLCRPNLELVVPRYLVYILFSGYVQGQTLRNIKQTSGIQNLDLDGFMSEVSFIPPSNEQLVISEYLDEQSVKIHKLTDKSNEKINLLKEYRQSLISDVVTGKIRVTEELP